MWKNVLVNEETTIKHLKFLLSKMFSKSNIIVNILELKYKCRYMFLYLSKENKKNK